MANVVSYLHSYTNRHEVTVNGIMKFFVTTRIAHSDNVQIVKMIFSFPLFPLPLFPQASSYNKHTQIQLPVTIFRSPTLLSIPASTSYRFLNPLQYPSSSPSSSSFSSSFSSCCLFLTFMSLASLHLFYFPFITFSSLHSLQSSSHPHPHSHPYSHSYRYWSYSYRGIDSHVIIPTH